MLRRRNGRQPDAVLLATVPVGPLPSTIGQLHRLLQRALGGRKYLGERGLRPREIFRCVARGINLLLIDQKVSSRRRGFEGNSQQKSGRAQSGEFQFFTSKS